MRILVLAPLALLVTLAGGQDKAASAVDYRIDSVHSSVVFKIKRDVVFYFGRFDHIEGTVKYDKAKPTNTSIEIRIKADSVYTGNERRDNHLKSPDFFDVKQFDWITFKSTKIQEDGADGLKVEGELEIHGVKKTIQANVKKTGEQERRGKQIGFEVNFEIKRSDFDMKYGMGMLSDAVSITMGIRAQTGGGRRRGR